MLGWRLPTTASVPAAATWQVVHPTALGSPSHSVTTGARSFRHHGGRPAQGNLAARHWEVSASAFGITAPIGVTIALHLVLVARRRSSLNRRKKTRHAAAGAECDVDAWRRGFFDTKELDDGYYVLEDVAGLPPDLRGTLFRNGPGNFSRNGVRVRHQMDGDGLILAVTFSEGGQVAVRHRLTQTQGLMRDVAYKRFVSKGRYGTPAEGGLPWDGMTGLVKQTANAGLLWWDEKLLAMSHEGKPYLIDPASLGTLIGNQDSGASDLGTVLGENDGFSPKARICASTNTLANFTEIPSTLGTQLRFFEFTDGKWNPRYRIARSAKVSGYTSFADFSVTKRWFVLARPPVKVDSLGAALGKSTKQVLLHDADGTGELIFVSRDKQGSEVIVPVDNLVCEEFANAFECEDGKIVLDCVVADRWDPHLPRDNVSTPLWEQENPSGWPRQQLVRYEVDLQAKTWTKCTCCERHIGLTSVNASVSGLQHRYIFCAVGHSETGIGPMAGVGKIDMQSSTFTVDCWVPNSTEFCCQPVFVARQGSVEEDDGYLLSILFDGDAQRTEVVVLDARNVSQGPVCRIPLKTAVPHGFQACWAQGLMYSAEELKRKLVLRRMYQRKSREWNASSSGLGFFGGAESTKQGTKMR
mmetsp:Transcript_124702/g.248983  ORF Transcript_124702/g.248983 Transcript_124702/m.248983 type:complete len:640 (+) Transcript_124702:46-1965(+)